MLALEARCTSSKPSDDMLGPPLFLVYREMPKKLGIWLFRKFSDFVTPLFDLLRLGCIAPRKYWGYLELIFF
jgi:hypothetical protein